ncbi:MAG: SRPBCC domain-containing protein [Steroidobacter sp.]
MCIQPLNSLATALTRALIGVVLGFLALLTGPAMAAEPQVTEGFINTTTAEVWRIFTTAEGFKLTGAAHAEVELKIGGSIRSHYNPQGQLGDAETIVNEILAYEPERMLAIRIKQAPASFPHKEAAAGTWTVIYMNPAGDNMTQVRIVGLGYTDTPQSQAMSKFFAEGNRWTLDHIAKRYWPKCPKCVAEEAEAASR